MKNLLNIIVLGCLIIGALKGQVINNNGSGLSGTNGFTLNNNGTNIPFNPTSPNAPSNSGAPQGLQDRGVFWLHGLGGDHHSWSKAADASQHGRALNFASKGYKINSHTTGLTYSEKSTLLLAAQDVRGFIGREATQQRQNDVDPKNNFIIAHSQGGLVSQALLYKDFCFDPNIGGPDYGGIVTFGSAHQGAMIINNAKKIQSWVESGCSDLAAGPAENLRNSFVGFLLKFFVDESKNPLNPANIDSLCTNFVGKLIDIVDLLKPITKDYMVQGKDGVLNEFKECIEANADEIKKVAFYGIEPTKDLPWRTLQWMMVEDVNSVDKFQANDDKSFAEVIHNIKNDYVKEIVVRQNTVSYLETVHGMPCSWLDWILKLNLCLTYDKKYWQLKDEIGEYQKGVRWFDSADDKWEEIIGALQITEKKKYFCECISNNNEEIKEITDPAECPLRKGSKKCHILEEIEYIKSYKPSDGVVLAESASEFPGATTLQPGGPSRELTNSSHMQMRNDDNLRQKLTKLYNGDYNLFFKTYLR
ncbi:MAG: hypothetical protein ABI851_08410 [Saprospiraceae bacterium]